MQDLSLHVLDIVQNSIRAQATWIIVEMIEAPEDNKLKLIIADNGKGMSQKMAEEVTNPFVTTRKTRRVGLGLPLLYQNALNAGGSLKIFSKENEGTRIEALMQYNHIDRLPIGDMASTLTMLIEANPEREFTYRHVYKGKNFILKTAEIKNILKGVPINNPEIINWLRQYIHQQITSLYTAEN